MNYFYSVCALLAGLGAFLLGFKLLSDNIEKLATDSLRNWFNKTSKNKMVGVGIGLAATAIVQSSSVTTVMTVGLVNAGIMSLYQATTVIMGANIGTTVTAQIVALQSFKFVDIASILACVGTFMVMFAKKDKTKTIGYAFAGLGLVFVGLTFMSDAMADFRKSKVIVDVLASCNNPFLLLFIGMLFTAVIQSSSAVTSIIISMAAEGLIIGSGGNSVLFVILGTNIGTCVTALISSVGVNTNAKRASAIHLMFNVFGSILFMIILLIWKDFMANTLESWFSLPSTQIAMFHTGFNTICTCLFLPFTGVFVKVANKIIPDKKEQKQNKQTLLDKRFINTEGVAIGMAINETVAMIDDAMTALKLSFNGFISKDASMSKEVDKLIKSVSDNNTQISKYIVDISAQNISLKDEKRVSVLHSSLSDVVRISELADNLLKYTKRSIEDGLIFSEKVIEELKYMYGQIDDLYVNTVKAFRDGDKTALAEVEKTEAIIDNCRSSLIADHIKRLNEGRCQPASSSVFINLVGNLERAADHLTYVAHAFDEV